MVTIAVAAVINNTIQAPDTNKNSKIANTKVGINKRRSKKKSRSEASLPSIDNQLRNRIESQKAMERGTPDAMIM
jgi:hypothetical protein